MYRKKLREFRKSKGLTIKQFSKSIYMSTSGYAYLEQGKGGGTFSVWYSIAKVYNLSLEQLAELYFDK